MGQYSENMFLYISTIWNNSICFQLLKLNHKVIDPMIPVPWMACMLHYIFVILATIIQYARDEF